MNFFNRKKQRSSRKDNENIKESILDIIGRFIYAFEDIGATNNYDLFFKKIYDKFDENEGYDAVYRLYQLWKEKKINYDILEKYIK